MFRLAFVALLWLGAATNAVAQAQNPIEKTRDAVTALAFDPAKFFSGDDGEDLIRFSYTGDDYAWPVYAIAIRSGCLKGQTATCGRERIARMVRAPAIEDMERPRWRGSALISKVNAQKPRHPEDVAKILDTVGMQWVEANLRSCPNAMTVLAEGNNLVWVVPDIFTPEPDPEFEMVLHADTVTLEFPDYLRKATYRGYLAKGSPAEWADKLAKTLEPCWQAAKATAPWRY